MDTLVYGKKGSGKSYYAAYKINELKDPNKVLHNIKGLKIGLNINEEAAVLGIKSIDFFRNSLHDNETPSPLFDERFLKYRGFLFVIDEATDFFPDTFKDADVFKFFRMSRHYVIDTILITQFLDILCKKIYLHAELHIKALPDISNPIPGYFVYHEMSVNEKGWGEKVGVQKLRKKKVVFDSYESADYGAASPRKKPKPMQIMLVGALLITLAAASGFIYFLQSRKTTMEEKASAKQEKIEQYRKENPQNNITNNTPKNNQSMSNNNNYQEQGYPESMIVKMDGVFMPVSQFRNRKGVFVIILGIPYKRENSPYPIHKSEFGLVALVPRDIYEYQMKLNKEARDRPQIDPNQAWYYKENVASVGKDTP